MDKINEIKENKDILLIKSEMDKCEYYTKSSFFINNKNTDKFQAIYIFEKLFPMKIPSK